MPHRGRYTERPAPATDAARVGQDATEVQARPVARAVFFATRLSPAPVFRAALFADLMAFVVLDFLRLAFFMISPVPRFVQFG
jgi:hypothetical protein